jgi:hypothetical protein
LLLALVGLACWRGRERWWWGGLALAAAIYSLGVNTPLYGLLYRFLPPLGWLRGPARAWFVVVSAAAVLAAQGLTALEERISQQRWMDRVAVGCVGALLAGVAVRVVRDMLANVVAAAATWPLAGMLAALRAGGRLRRSTFAGLILILALVDLYYVGFTLYRVRQADEVLSEGEEAAAWLAAQPGPFRVYSPSYSIPHHIGAIYAIEAADGVDPFQLADYVDFMRVATGVDLPGYSVTVPAFPELAAGEDMLQAHRGVVPDLKLLGLLNVRYLAAAYPMQVEGLESVGEYDGVYLYQNRWALPRVFVKGQESGEKARIVRWTPNRIQVEAEGPGLLVLSEIYDPDWRVQVDGESAGMVRAERILRGVYLEDGHHEVIFTYRPAGLWVGVGMTAAGWVLVMALYVIGRGWERRHE